MTKTRAEARRAEWERLDALRREYEERADPLRYDDAASWAIAGALIRLVIELEACGYALIDLPGQLG